jgi:hypothetical protein
MTSMATWRHTALPLAAAVLLLAAGQGAKASPAGQNLLTEWPPRQANFEKAYPGEKFNAADLATEFHALDQSYDAYLEKRKSVNGANIKGNPQLVSALNALLLKADSIGHLLDRYNAVINYQKPITGNTAREDALATLKKFSNYLTILRNTPKP